MNKECCEWKGAKNVAGYGTIRMNGKTYLAHRLAVALSGRNIPKSLVCDHLCRNRACVNPDHIELVSTKENVLRGIGPTAQAAKQTACLKGHEYTPENTRYQQEKRGGKGGITRQCRKCAAIAAYARDRKKGARLRPGATKYDYSNLVA